MMVLTLSNVRRLLLYIHMLEDDDCRQITVMKQSLVPILDLSRFYDRDVTCTWYTVMYNELEL